MTVKELKKELDYFDDEQEVRLATQPNYPLEYGIDSVVENEDEDSNGVVVYIREGNQKGYYGGTKW